MAKKPNARGAGQGLLPGALLWMGLAMGCLQSEPGTPLAGSGTELGNVMGVLIAPDRRAAGGVEVMLHPLEADAGSGQDSILRTMTNADGAFAFQVERGAFRLMALDGAGNGVTVDSLLPSRQDTINLQEIDLEPLGSIRGFVKSGSAEAQLELLGTYFNTSFSGNTDFNWGGIPAGSYWLQARQSGGMVGPNSLKFVVSVSPGSETVLPDTLDLTTIPLELQSVELPYWLGEGVRPDNGMEVDSLYFILNGVRMENQAPGQYLGFIYLTEAMLDSTRVNVVRLCVHSGDSVFVARNWSITWNRSRPVKWAYQAVRAVIQAMEPDNRPEAMRPGPNGGNPQKGTFRVLEKRRLSPEELEYWEWPVEAGGDVSATGIIQASIHNPAPMMHRGCIGRISSPIPDFPGDTVTFFLLPDSLLGAVAFRLRTDERFQDMDRLGYFARADWPLGSYFPTFRKQGELRMNLGPEGMRIEWPWNFMFQGSEPRCQSTYRRFLVDSAGRVRELLAVPPEIDSSRLLLHYRSEFGTGIDADSLPASGASVYIDSAGLGVSGSRDTVRQFQMEPGDLEELKTLLSALPDPVPADWYREHATTVWLEGSKEALRYMVADQRGVLHILGHPDAAPAKADLFSRVEQWLRSRNFL